MPHSALLLIDVINDVDFPGNEGLLVELPSLVQSLSTLKRAAKKAACPVIYVNDNFQQWRSSFEQTLAHCIRNESPGRQMARQLAPDKDDYFVLKPMHSGFYCTPLELLLAELKIRKLILGGVAGNICVFFTASDAYMRGFELAVPADCIASNTRQDNEHALQQMALIHRADIRRSSEIIRSLEHFDSEERSTGTSMSSERAATKL